MNDNLDEYFDYDVILRRMLDKVSNNIDKREGSIIYDALAPCAAELAQMYLVIKDSIDLAFVDTAVDEYLDRLSDQIGLVRKQATNAIRQAEFKDENGHLFDIQIGSRFTIGELAFKTIEKIQTGIYKMECEISGATGNALSGKLIPINYIEHLGTATLTDILIPR